MLKALFLVLLVLGFNFEATVCAAQNPKAADLVEDGQKIDLSSER